MKKVYLVEDSPLQMEMMRSVLERIPNVRLACFSDGLELYLAAQKDPPDLLVADIILPNVSGLALARLLKFHGDFARMKMLVVSSITDPELRSTVARCGADAFLPKPLDYDAFGERVKALLAAN